MRISSLCITILGLFASPVKAFAPPPLRRVSSSLALYSSAVTESFDEKLKEGKLQAAIDILRENPGMEISRDRWNSMFSAIEERTRTAEENTSAAPGAATEFPVESTARKEMTALYNLLKEQGKLKLYGAIDTKLNPIVGGSYTIPQEVMEEVLSMPMTSLTPKPTNTLLIAGAAVAVLEGIASVLTGIPLDNLVFSTLLAVFVDRLFFNGAVFETFLKFFSPGISEKILRHEAGHFLAAYLLGCPVEGIVLSAWAALQDERFSARQVSAGTSFFDPELSRQINTKGQVTRSALDRYSIIVMGGIAAEADHYGRADGGAGDEMALVAFLSQLGAAIGNGESIKNQARWGVMNAVLMLREYKPAYEALVDALERGGTLGDCIFAIEKAARDHNLGPLAKPNGFLTETEGSIKWTKEAPQLLQETATVAIQEQPKMSREESLRALQDYKASVEEKLRKVEERLKELE